jgi:hypothetical protein
VGKETRKGNRINGVCFETENKETKRSEEEMKVNTKLPCPKHEGIERE